MKPFVEAGMPWLYTVQGAIDAGIIYGSYKMKKSDTKWKKVWWVIPTAVMVGHLAAGTHNIKIALKF